MYVFNDLRYDVVVRFVDIGLIVHFDNDFFFIHVFQHSLCMFHCEHNNKDFLENACARKIGMHYYSVRNHRSYPSLYKLK
jgi:hypothetical protein